MEWQIIFSLLFIPEYWGNFVATLSYNVIYELCMALWITYCFFINIYKYDIFHTFVIFQWLQCSLSNNVAEVCLYTNLWCTAEQIKYQESGIKFINDFVSRQITQCWPQCHITFIPKFGTVFWRTTLITDVGKPHSGTRQVINLQSARKIQHYETTSSNIFSLTTFRWLSARLSYLHC